MPAPSELQHLTQRLKSLSEVCQQNAALKTRQQLAAAAFGLSCDLSFLSQLFDVCVAACKDLKHMRRPNAWSRIRSSTPTPCLSLAQEDRQGAAQICITGAAAALFYLPGRGLKTSFHSSIHVASAALNIWIWIKQRPQSAKGVGWLGLKSFQRLPPSKEERAAAAAAAEGSSAQPVHAMHASQLLSVRANMG
eukprot:scaffold66169_cov20-Tisochrysis_lutea.AAC.2